MTDIVTIARNIVIGLLESQETEISLEDQRSFSSAFSDGFNK